MWEGKILTWRKVLKDQLRRDMKSRVADETILYSGKTKK